MIRYEDFVKEKKTAIDSPASELGLNICEDITEHVDAQYQKKGNKNSSPYDVFGENNLQMIQEICGESAKALGYEL